jgi:adenosylmethionine-8-amino-7-oxononanoate aminotransferase
MLNTPLELDRKHIWHPYSAIGKQQTLFHVDSAEGCTLTLKDGTELIDGMASWWSVIHGYNHPKLNEALKNQIDKMSHVMFGGLTHDPAIHLAKLLVDITPQDLQAVFFADSGSVAVEVAMKMAIQYWTSQDNMNKQRFIALERGYHGDTFAAMSVCDPINGMHSLFADAIMKQHFVPAPVSEFGKPCEQQDIIALRDCLEQHHESVAAIILEPIVQGAGGMRFYSADYLSQARILADEFGVLLIFDEIATGFGRTGKLFACEHANVTPDILCLGKALTGGYMTLAAALTTEKVSQAISHGNPGVFMHGPTFMANPLACAVAGAALRLLEQKDWAVQVGAIETQLQQALLPLAALASVAEVRVLGAIGVMEMVEQVDVAQAQALFIDRGVWLRPFGKLIYIMPAYVMTPADLQTVVDAMAAFARSLILTEPV